MGGLVMGGLVMGGLAIYALARISRRKRCGPGIPSRSAPCANPAAFCPVHGGRLARNGDHRLNLDRSTQRQSRNPDRRARMVTTLTKQIDIQVRCTIYNGRLAGKLRA